MSYVDPFGGMPLSPTSVSYAAITIAVDTTLDVPSLTTTGITTAAIIQVTATLASLSLLMPPASRLGNGFSILLSNVGANTFTVKDNSGNTLTTLNTGENKYVYVTNNSTVAGVWSIVALGIGTSTIDATVLAGAGTKAVTGKLVTATPTIQKNVPYQLVVGDRASLFSDTVGITLTLPTVGGAGNDYFVMIKNSSVGSTTVAASGADLIDTVTSITLAPQESVIVVCSGSTWNTVGRGQSTSFAYSQLVKNVAGSSNITLTSTEAAYKILKFTGVLTGNIDIITPNVSTVWYIDNSTTGAFTLRVKTSAGTGIYVATNNRVILYCDGTNVLDAQTAFVSSGLFSAGTVTNPGLAFSGNTNTGLYNPSLGVVGVTTNGVLSGSFTSTGFQGAIGVTTQYASSFTSVQTLTISGMTTPLSKAQGGTGSTTNAASAVVNTPAGNIVATDVQSAITELDTKKVPRTSLVGSALIPASTTVNRDATPVTGYFRFNTDLVKFEGYNGTAWGSVGGGATGAGTDAVFIENDQTVNNSYTLTTGKNASTAGPITIATGVVVTIPTGATWSVI